MEHVSLSVHDNHLVSYCVRADAKEIRFHTVDPDGDPPQRTDVLFTGVACYHFESDSFQTILFGVDEVNADALYAEYRDLFVNGRKYGWPGTWSATEDTVLAYLIENEIKGYRISSSLGMAGWVLAKSLRLLEATG